MSPAAKLYSENTQRLPHVTSDAVERVSRSAAVAPTEPNYTLGVIRLWVSEAENRNNKMFNGGVQAKATLVAARRTVFDS